MFSSAGLRALMIASKAAKGRNLGLGVAGMQPVVREIFAIQPLRPGDRLLRDGADALGKLDPAAVDHLAGMQRSPSGARAARSRCALASQVRDKDHGRADPAGGPTSRHPMPPRLRREPS